MEKDRLLVIAISLITLGLAGIFAATWVGYQWQGGMSPMMDMMMDGGMMGRGMMDRDRMRDMMQRMMPGMLPPGIKAEDLPDPDSKGARLLTRYCDECHYVPSPRMHSAEEWPLIANRMFSRMSMMSGMSGMGMMGIESPSPEERLEILTYLKTHSLRSISPEELPSPESEGATLFKDACSQCHALPDPKLYPAGKWPGVVERMQNNMQAMRRRVITDREKKEIIAYLSDHARK